MIGGEWKRAGGDRQSPLLVPFRSIEEWIRLREAYWDSITSGDDEHPFLSHDLLTNTRALREADSIVLWVWIGAAEQLLLSWMVSLLAHIESRAQHNRAGMA